MEYYKIRIGKSKEEIISYFDDFIDNHHLYKNIRDKEYNNFTEYNLKRHLISSFTLKHYKLETDSWNDKNAGAIYSILYNNCEYPFNRANDDLKKNEEIIDITLSAFTLKAFQYKSLKLLKKVKSKFKIEVTEEFSSFDVQNGRDYGRDIYIEFVLKKQDLKSFLKLFDKKNLFKIIEYKVESDSFENEILVMGKYTLPWGDIYKNDVYKNIFNNVEYLDLNKKNICFETFFKNCQQFDLEVLLSLKDLILVRKRYKKLISKYPNLTEDVVINNLDLWNKKNLSLNKVVTTSDKIILNYFFILDFKKLSNNQHLNYQNLVDLAHIFKPSVVYERLDQLLRSKGRTGMRTYDEAKEIRDKILNDFNWYDVLNDYRLRIKWDSENIVPLIEILDNGKGLWEIIVAKVEWNTNNIIPYIEKFDSLEGIWDIIARETTNMDFFFKIIDKISFENFICSDHQIVWDCYLLDKLMDLKLSLFCNSAGSKGESPFQLPTILETIKISNDALLKYKDFWQKEYLFHTYTYKRGESFTDYKGTFPLYKRLYNNTKLDKEFLIKNIIPKDVDLESLKYSDVDTRYLDYR